MSLSKELRDHEGNTHRDGFTCVRCRAADEIEWLRAEVDDLKRINMNLRYLIPEAVWIDEADRLRGDNQESPANEIERLRALITAWADEQVPFRLLTTAEDELRKAVGQ